MPSRLDTIWRAIANGTPPETLPKPQSRNEALLMGILNKIGESGGGGGEEMSIHVCSASEYSQITGMPTIENPSTNTIYLVPTGDGENNLYDEWVYVNNNWEKFGSSVTVDTTLNELNDVAISGATDKQALVYNSETGEWENTSMNPVCFNEDGEFVLDGGDASELD